METAALLKPTLHIEVAVKQHSIGDQTLRKALQLWLVDHLEALQIGSEVEEYGDFKYARVIERVEVADFTGVPNAANIYGIDAVELDIQTYTLKSGSDTPERRTIAQSSDDDLPQARILALPNVQLKEEWNSLVYDDRLPWRILRILTRMVGIMRQSDLNLAAFNWNRLYLLHGPPGSGKSTLCRALAQKLSIRLSNIFPKATLVEIDTNAMLSKYFGESGKLIGATFGKICDMAQNPGMLVCVVMDEVETIAGSRERSTEGNECGDGLRATNQLLTALDRLRHLPNAIVLCTSNLITAIDQAFLDRVDIKQLVPSPSSIAIYNIFRCCFNELLKSGLVQEKVTQTVLSTPKRSGREMVGQDVPPAKRQARATRSTPAPPPSSSPEGWTAVDPPEIPSYAVMATRFVQSPQAPCRRLWDIAQQCQGLSGRTLRRLPVLGLAMYTYGGTCSLDDAVEALAKAVEQEVKARTSESIVAGKEYA